MTVKLQARIKDVSKYPSVVDVGSRKYWKGKWRDVPAGEAELARSLDWLEFQEVNQSTPVPAKVPNIPAVPSPSSGFFKREEKSPEIRRDNVPHPDDPENTVEIRRPYQRRRRGGTDQ